MTLWVLGLDGSRREIRWDDGALPYLVDVQWPQQDRIVLTVQSRDQRHLQVLAADPASGDTTILFEDRTRRGWSWCPARRPASTTAGW